MPFLVEHGGQEVPERPRGHHALLAELKQLMAELQALLPGLGRTEHANNSGVPWGEKEEEQVVTEQALPTDLTGNEHAKKGIRKREEEEQEGAVSECCKASGRRWQGLRGQGSAGGTPLYVQPFSVQYNTELRSTVHYRGTIVQSYIGTNLLHTVTGHRWRVLRSQGAAGRDLQRSFGSQWPLSGQYTTALL